ncbi:hypothetical protein F5Y04DRAFT_275189 [Hypomontagnella monticulosa]|nr:hypothetical protein F5Y04DRAFT_275189 [Hypomontagnella monticulosa]
MAETFHSFSSLPRELRDKIWGFAARPGGDCRGAHIFRIYHVSEHGMSKDEVVMPARYSGDIRLAAPRCVPTSPSNNLEKSQGQEATFSWTRDNFSTYLIDGGLWNACKESRLVMERRFQSKKWKTVRDDFFGTQEQWSQYRGMMPTTGYFRSDESTGRYFTVFPKYDLFCLQPPNLATLNWKQIANSIVWGSNTWAFQGLRHVALEFDPAWAVAIWDTLRSRKPVTVDSADIIKVLVNMAFDAYQLEQVWLIDYRIKRKCYVRTKEEASENRDMVFHGTDRRFVEMTYENRDEWDRFYQVEDGIEISCDSFIMALEDARFEHYESTRIRLGYTMDEWDWNGPLFCTFGGLACEYL